MRKINQFIILAFGLFLTVAVFNSCVKDEEISITEPTRYTNNDVKSYADLFKVFWTVMDQRYNYFYEQKRTDGTDWNRIYREYYPKFSALKTFGRSTENDRDINNDRLKAIEYFTEIINPIIDQHFEVTIYFPSTNNSVSTSTKFFGGMKNKQNNTYGFSYKYNYMKNRLSSNGSLFVNNYLLAGNLKSNPDIYYFSFSRFSLADNLKINLSNKYLSPDEGNGLLLTIADIENSTELNAIKDITLKNKVKVFTTNILNQWNSYFTSTEISDFNNQIATFKNTEEVSDNFLNITLKALKKASTLVNYSDPATYSSIKTTESTPYITWFISRISTHIEWGYKYPDFSSDAQALVYKSPFYKQFLNPLHKGNIKKIIIDLRSNGGGNVVDARFLIDRFITKPSVWGYQRTKEGNGRFNYTPWVPMQSKPHTFGIPSNIPIVILTDKRSASMAEMTTMMIKNQGGHAISIGDYSAGATAGLGDPDDFNGGTTDDITRYFTFYMPLMATKDATGQVIEGIGVKPDIFVTPPTDEEVLAMKNSPLTFVDRVMNEAIKYLSK